MQKEIVIVVIIIIATFIVNIICNKFTNECISKTNEELEKIANLANEELSNQNNNNSNNIKSEIIKISNNWDTCKKKLAMYIEHDELEKVDTSIVEIKERLVLESYDEAIPEIKKCIYILNHIKQKETFEIINLF